AFEDEKRLLRHVERLTAIHEAGHALPWRVSDAPADYRERMRQTTVGLEIPMRTLQGKWRTSQNRSRGDGRGVVAGLTEKGSAAANEMAELIARQIENEPRR